MPIIAVRKKILDDKLEKNYSEREFDELCFNYGLELDEVTSEKATIQKEQGQQAASDANDEEVYKIELPANRYDLLSVEGLSKALLVFLDKHPIPVYRLKRSNNPQKIFVKPETGQVRPFIVAAVLKNITFTDDSYASFIDLQDKLHQTICRNRTLIAIGTHDLDTIQGEHSKITTKTENVLIESTATDLTKAKIVLDTIVTLFSQYCQEQFTIEPVVIHNADGTVVEYPELTYRDELVKVSEINTNIGLNLTADEMAVLLTKMCLKCSVVDDGRQLKVTVPPTRHDVIHSCDIAEDLAIAFGFSRIEQHLPCISTIAGAFPINKLADSLRMDIAAAGWTETLNFALCSREDVSSKLRRNDGLSEAVKILNPKTAEFQVARTTLLPGLLHTLANNRDMPMPLRLFELQDVVLKDALSDVGARNERRLGAIYCGKCAGFETIHGLLDRIMQLLDVQCTKTGRGYFIREKCDSTYLDGRCAQVIGPRGTPVGKLGIVHPDVLVAFGLTLPMSSLEINIEHFL